MDIMTRSKYYKMLEENGPLTKHELGESFMLTLTLRDMDVYKFHPLVNTKGSTLSGGQTVGVYYIKFEHDPGEIIESWLDANPGMVDRISNWAIHSRISGYNKGFIEASREILGPFDLNLEPTGGKPTKKFCDLCGDDIPKSLADHLPDCENRMD